MTFTAVTWKPFADHSGLELSLKCTQTCVWVSHTEWSSEGMQWCSTIPWFNSEHMSFQHSHALTICIANMVSYTTVTYSCLCIWWMWEFAASNEDAHTNKQTNHNRYLSKLPFPIGVPRLFSFFQPVTCDLSHPPKGRSPHRHRKWPSGSEEVRQGQAVLIEGWWQVIRRSNDD